MRFAQKTRQRHGERQVLRFQEPWEVNSVFGHGLNLALSTVRLTQWNEKDETAWWIWGARGQEARKRNLISIEKYIHGTNDAKEYGGWRKQAGPQTLCTLHPAPAHILHANACSGTDGWYPWDGSFHQLSNLAIPASLGISVVLAIWNWCFESLDCAACDTC